MSLLVKTDMQEVSFSVILWNHMIKICKAKRESQYYGLKCHEHPNAAKHLQWHFSETFNMC